MESMLRSRGAAIWLLVVVTLVGLVGTDTHGQSSASDSDKPTWSPVNNRSSAGPMFGIKIGASISNLKDETNNK